MSRLQSWIVLGAGVALSLGLAYPMPILPVSEAQARNNKDARKEEAREPIEARLVLKKDKYVLDMGGKTADDYKKAVKAGTDQNPPQLSAPQVEMELELRNTSEKEVKLAVGGTRTFLGFDLEGPGALTYKSDHPHLRWSHFALVAPQVVAIAPGKTHTLPIKSLSSLEVLIPGGRALIHGGEQAFWTAAGEYTLTVRFHTATNPAPRQQVKDGDPFDGDDPMPGGGVRILGEGFGRAILTTRPVKFQVVEKP